MQLHLQTDKSQEGVTGTLTCDYLHGFCPAFELFVEPLDDIRCLQTDPVLSREMKKRQTVLYGSFQAFNSRGDFLFPLLLKKIKIPHGFLF